MEMMEEPCDSEDYNSSSSSDDGSESNEDWILLKFLDGDESFWIAPVSYMAGYQKWTVHRSPLNGITVSVWNGCAGVPLRREGDFNLKKNPENRFRPAKIICNKKTPCCALRAFRFGMIIEREGVNSQIVETLAKSQRSPNEEFTQALAVAELSASKDEKECQLELTTGVPEQTEEANINSPLLNNSSSKESVMENPVSETASDDFSSESETDYEGSVDDQCSNSGSENVCKDDWSFECGQRWFDD